jgi:hypothetical protein
MVRHWRLWMFRREALNASLAFGAGLAGAAVMVLGIWISHAMGGTEFNFSRWWGTIVVGQVTRETMFLGATVHLLFGGLVGLLYGTAFWIIGRSNWRLGLAGGAVHAVIAGFALGGLSMIHPAVPEIISDPGFFTANYGVGSIVTFCAVHLAYGALVGRLYSATTSETTPPFGRRRRREPLLQEVPVRVDRRRRPFWYARQEWDAPRGTTWTAGAHRCPCA